MSYGLQVFRSYGTATLFDTTEAARTLTVVAQGTVNSALGTVTTTAGDALLVKPNGTLTNSSIAVSALTEITSGSGQSVQFTTTFNALYSSGSPPSTLSYVILRDTNQQSSQTGSYGLLCKTSSSIVEFDSRLFSASQEFLITELNTFRYGHQSTLSSTVTDNNYFSANMMYDSTVSNFDRKQGYIWENTNSSTIVWPGYFNGSFTTGRIFGSSSSSGSVKVFSETTSVGGAKTYNDLTFQSFYKGAFRT